MADAAQTPQDDAPAKPRGRRMLLLALPLLAALGGAASSYLGLWSPLALVGFGAPAAAEGGHDTAPEAHGEGNGEGHGEGHGQAGGGGIAFVDLPPINVTLPDARTRMLHLVVKLETEEAAKARVEHLLPRVSDAFNTFLTGIAPASFERRGILEVVRDELTTRARLAIGDDTPVEVLVTEFALK